MVSVIIPTLNSEKYIKNQLEILNSQELEDQVEIIVIDSESQDRTVEIAESLGARVIKIERKDFDHGGTRNLGWREAKGDIVCYLTGDAIPKNKEYLRNLIKGFCDKSVMMISGRQEARPDAAPQEKLTRLFNYPETGFTRDKGDLPRLGIKTYFFSDACAAYRKAFLEEMGGFETPILTNEDMLMAARAINKGYKIGYAGDATVLHSHNFSLSYLYKRNFDVAVFLKQHADEIESGGTTGEGVKMVKYTIVNLLKQGHILSVFRCIAESGAKFLGNRAGRNYEKLSKKEILKKTSNPNYWKHIEA